MEPQSKKNTDAHNAKIADAVYKELNVLKTTHRRAADYVTQIGLKRIIDAAT